jgi:hypothetical protein
MPRLPTALDLGEPLVIRPTRDFLRYTPRLGLEQAGESITRAGQAVGELGSAMQQIDQRLTEARRASQLNEAVGRATESLGRLEIQYGQDTDFKTSPDRFSKDVEGLRSEFEKTIDDPVVRSSFAQHFQTLATTKRLNVLKQAVNQEQDYNVSQLTSNRKIYAQAAANAQNDAERQLIMSQWEVSVGGMQQAGWITRQDAANKILQFNTDIDEARLEEALSKSPDEAAFRLAAEPEYLANLDPIKRNRAIEEGFNRAAEAERRQRTESERIRGEQREAIMKTAWDMNTANTLNRGFIQRVRPIVTDGEYHELLTAMRRKETGDDAEDDKAAVAVMEDALDRDPDEAIRLARSYYRTDMLTTSTFKSFRDKARSLLAGEKPPPVYKAQRDKIRDALAVPESVYDPAGRARYAIAIEEFDNFARGKDRSDKELTDHADDVLKRRSLLDMRAIAEKTSVGVRQSPQGQIDAITSQVRALQQNRDNNRITQEQYNREMRKLNDAMNAARKALQIQEGSKRAR